MAARKKSAGKKSMIRKVKEVTGGVPTEFGAFYPMGYVVVAFSRNATARRVRRSLLTGGYDERDALHFSAAAVTRSLQRNLDNAGLLASLGGTKDALRRHLRLARQGCDFLMVHAATDEEVRRVMNVVRRGPFRLAQKFHRLAIEDLK